MTKRILLTLAAALAAAPFILSGVARAATTTPTPKPTPAPISNVFSTNYYSNAGDTDLPDGTVRIVNNSGAAECALLYVTDADQELRECCGCAISNGGTLTFSVDDDLTGNPANGVATSTGSVALISSKGGSVCNAAAPSPTPDLQAWETHPQTGDFLTEDEFTALPLSAAAERNLVAECAAIQLVGSGAGVCYCPGE